MTNTDRLLATEAIRSLKARYFRFIDTKDWNGFDSLFTVDAVLDISADVPGCIIHGAEQFVASIRPQLETCVSVHHGHCPEIRITSDSSAEGIWAMEDRIWWNEGSGSPVRTLHGMGHYHETYRRTDDGVWQISTMRLTRLRVDVTGW